MVGGALPVHEAVGALGPFEADEGTVEGVICYELAVEFTGFVFEEAHLDIDAGLQEHLQATASHLGVRVGHSDDEMGDAGVFQQQGARRRFAVMGAGFESDIHCGPGEALACAPRLYEVAIDDFSGVEAERGDGVDLGVSLSILSVPALGEETAVGTNDDGSDHRVGGDAATAALGEGKGTGHPLGRSDLGSH